MTSRKDETYENPVIPGDWSDPGVVRVGENYYSVRSTFGWQPGLHIAHSRDLVHWEYIGFADTGIIQIATCGIEWKTGEFLQVRCITQSYQGVINQ